MQKMQKLPSIDSDDGRKVKCYLSFQRDKLDQVLGSVGTGIVGNSYDDQYSLIVEAHERIFRAYSAMLAQNRKEKANNFISKALRRGF